MINKQEKIFKFTSHKRTTKKNDIQILPPLTENSQKKFYKF